MGGATIDPKKQANSLRRSIYFAHSRDDQHKFLSMFDDADILRCYRRDESIVPQQALALANSRLALETADALRRHVEFNLESPVTGRAKVAWRATAREERRRTRYPP